MTQVTNSGFQTIVNRQPAVGQAGDFYGTNPRTVILSGNSPAGGAGNSGAAALGQLVAPHSVDGFQPDGLVVGNFAWVDLTSGNVSQGYNTNGQLGVLHRDDTAVIVTYLGISTYVQNAGFAITLFSNADIWALFAAGAAVGQKVWADPVTGAPVAGGAAAPTTASFTGAVNHLTNVLTVTAVASGVLGQGAVIAGASVPAGSQILSQVSGTPGGIGTYNVSGTYGADVAAEAMTVAAVATPWKVKSKAGNGETAKISAWG